MLTRLLPVGVLRQERQVHGGRRLLLLLLLLLLQGEVAPISPARCRHVLAHRRQLEAGQPLCLLMLRTANRPKHT